MIADELKNEVIYSDNPSRLFEIMLEISEMVSGRYIDLAKTDDKVERTELKGEISVYNAMLDIIDKRIDDVKAGEHDKSRKELLANRQFRMAAKCVLQKETYERITELSTMNYKRFKNMKSSLKEEKLE